jgi:hypothetical protein
MPAPWMLNEVKHDIETGLLSPDYCWNRGWPKGNVKAQAGRNRRGPIGKMPASVEALNSLE